MIHCKNISMNKMMIIGLAVFVRLLIRNKTKNGYFIWCSSQEISAWLQIMKRLQNQLKKGRESSITRGDFCKNAICVFWTLSCLAFLSALISISVYNDSRLILLFQHCSVAYSRLHTNVKSTNDNCYQY